jgi:hypothetical protein
MRYEHKHQVLDPQQPNRGLLRMARDIGITVLAQLNRDGFSLRRGYSGSCPT